jgi:hypothetical protein
MEASAIAEEVKEAAHGIRTGDMGTSATPGIMVYRAYEERNKKTLDDGDNLD